MEIHCKLIYTYLNLNYNTVTDDKGSLFVGAQYSDYNGNVNDFINENGLVDNFLTKKYLKNKVGNITNIASIQTDYAKKISEDTTLEMGAKFSHAAINSETNFLVSKEKEDDFEIDTELSSDFKYDEKIGAAYFSYLSSLDEKFSYSFGVRGEWTNYDLRTNANGNQEFKKSYVNFFPNVLLNMNVLDELKMHVSYVSRITRPRYQSLNPFVIYQDPFTTIEGNPNLVPEKVHAFEIGVFYKKIDFKIGYTHKTDPISAAALRGDNPNSYILKAINLDRENTFFASLSRSFKNKIWSSVNTVSVSYSKAVDHKYSYEFGTVKPQLYLYSNNTFAIPNLFKVQLLAWYLGDRGYGLGNDDNRSTVTIGIERNFFDDALRLNFTANDIFHKFRTSGNYNVGQTEIYYHRTYTTNYFRLVATYNFGNSKKQTFKKVKTEEVENNRAR